MYRLLFFNVPFRDELTDLVGESNETLLSESILRNAIFTRRNVILKNLESVPGPQKDRFLSLYFQVVGLRLNNSILVGTEAFLNQEEENLEWEIQQDLNESSSQQTIQYLQHSEL